MMSCLFCSAALVRKHMREYGMIAWAAREAVVVKLMDPCCLMLNDGDDEVKSKTFSRK